MFVIALAAGCRRPAADPVRITPAVQALHDRAFIADLHMDPLMHHRDLLHGAADLDTDVPRLRQAGVDLAGFGIVTEPVPIFGEFGIRVGAWLWGWPRAQRLSPLARALAQLDELDALVAADHDLRSVRTREDLAAARADGALGIIALLEGAKVFADDPATIRQLYDRGVRIVGLTHLRDNVLGGSGSPAVPVVDWYLGGDAGLTDSGRSVLTEMAKLGYIVDLAHTSPRTFDDILAAWKGPVLVSHTATAALHPGTRNITDEQLRAVARRGGVVGIMIATNFIGSDHLAAVADHLVHAVRVAGADHVALGLDLDGLVTLPVEFHDVRDLPKVTQLLYDRGLTTDELEQVLGLSSFRFFSTALPAAS